jgi:hypothetical protein
MFIKRFKRKCDVRGCKNTANVFLISKRREMGNTIAVCTDCLKEAQASIDGYVEEKKTIIKVDKPLFPHPELEVTLSSVAEKEPKPQEVIKQQTEELPVSVEEDTVTIEKNTTPADNSNETTKPRTTNTNKRNSNKK